MPKDLLAFLIAFFASVGLTAPVRQLALRVGLVDKPGPRKVHLKPQESVHLEFTLESRAFAYWSEKVHGWKIDPGHFVISAGDSSVNLPLSVGLELTAQDAVVATLQ